MAAQDDYLIDTLVELGYVKPEQVEQVRPDADSTGESVVHLLINRGVLTSTAVTQAKATHFGVEMVDLTGIKLEDEAIAAVPRHIAKRYRVVPLYKHGNSLAVVVSDPSDLNTQDTLSHLLNAELEYKVATDEQIDATLNKYYGSADTSVDRAIQDITEGEVDLATVQGALADDGSVVEADAPIIKLVNQVIVEAFRARASDIHLEPLAKRFRVRYRIDGVLHEIKSPPKRLQAAIISRLKILSNMSIAERRIPQDGRIQTSVGGKTIDLRVSCLPTNHGESIVMRILDKEGLRLGLPELGFFTDDQQTFETAHRPARRHPAGHRSDRLGQDHDALRGAQLHQPAGPQDHHRRGPGRIHSGGHQPGAGQRNGGLDLFGRPAVHAAPGAQHHHGGGNPRPGDGHHCDQGLADRPPGLLHPAHQRRPQRGHPPDRHRRQAVPGRLLHCGPSWPSAWCARSARSAAPRTRPTDAELRQPRHPAASEAAKASFMRGRGCNDCGKTGYRGRMGIFEIFVIDDEARKLIYDKVSSAVLRSRAREMGMRTLREDGARQGAGRPDHPR